MRNMIKRTVGAAILAPVAVGVVGLSSPANASTPETGQVVAHRVVTPGNCSLVQPNKDIDGYTEYGPYPTLPEAKEVANDIDKSMGGSSFIESDGGSGGAGPFGVFWRPDC